MAPKKSLAESYQLFFNNLFNFNGRTRRSDFWRVVILNTVCVGVIVGILSAAFGRESTVASTVNSLLSLAQFVLQLGLVIRRLHDTGKEWTYYLLGLIPFVGWIIVFIALVTDSDPGDNKFGPNPKGGVDMGGFQGQPQQPAQPYAPVQQQPAQPYAPVQQQPAQPYAPVQPAQQYTPVQPVEPAQTYEPAQSADIDQPTQPIAPAEAPAQPVAAAPAPAEPAQPAKAAFCTNCGTPLAEGAVVCPSCGTAVNG